MRIVLFLVLFSRAVPAVAASFNCAQARLADERAVCHSRLLSEMDVEMAVRFHALSGLVAMGTRGDMGDKQMQFLAARHACGSDVKCLMPLYRARIAVLNSSMKA